MQFQRQMRAAAASQALLWLLLSTFLFATLAAGRSKSAPESELMLYSDPRFQGRRWALKLAEGQKGTCQASPKNATIRSIRMPGPTNDKWGCCAFYRTDCPTGPTNHVHIRRALYQLVTDDVADLAPTGWSGKQIRSFACLADADCVALGDDEAKNSEGGYMFAFWLSMTDLPEYIHDGGANDMVKDILGQD